MNKPLSRLMIISIVVSALAGCSTMRNLQIENPRYTIRDIKPRVQIALPFSASTVDFNFNVGVENPNPVGLRLDRIDFDVLLNGSHVVHAITRNGVRIPARGNGNVNLRASVGATELKSLFNEVVDAVQGQRGNYQLQGRAYYDTPVGQMNFPFTVYSTPVR